MTKGTRVVELGDVCRFIGGGTPSRKRRDYFEGRIPWATVKDFKKLRMSDTEEHITEAAVEESAANLVEPGTVLLVTRVGLGKVALAQQRMAINQDIKGLVPNKDLMAEYLMWFLLNRAPAIEKMGAGATVKGVTLNDIRTMPIEVPPHSEQQAIVDLLSRADGVLRLQREETKKAGQLISSLFVQMFRDTEPDNYRRCEDVCGFITKELSENKCTELRS